VGLFAEYESLPIGPLEFGLGAKLDSVFADSDAANMPPEIASMSGARTPNALYRAYYGTDASSRVESNPAALARMRYHLAEEFSLVAGFSRSMRTADTTERYIASDMGPSSWVGNPGLKPETHWQTEAGIEVRSQRWYASLVGYYDAVDNFIFRDIARGQPGILLSDGASVYRNIEAQLSGIEFTSRVQMTSSLSASLNGTFTYGENKDSHQPLPQIPPFSMRFNL